MKFLSRMFVFLLFLIVVSPAYAMTARGGDAVYVPKDEVVTGTLFAGGNAVTIDGTLRGDLICGAQSVVISGTVDGDVICGAQTVRISGTVGGSVRAGAQTIEISGPVGRNVMAGAQTITIDPAGAIAGEILAGAQTLSVYGVVTGDISAAVTSLAFGDQANVGGSVWYESNSPAKVAPSAVIAGTLTQSLPKVDKQKSLGQEMKKAAIGGGPANMFWKIVMYVVLAIIINAIAPKRTQKILDLMRAKPVPTAITGFIILVVVPVIIIALVITLVGIPFAILLGIVYALVLAASRIFAAILAGEYLTARLHLNRENNMLYNIILGVVVAWVVFGIPILGGLASFLAVIWGLGAMYVSRKSAAPAKRFRSAHSG
jgi:cytoskeletal protein CcmA (bactofilin family)